MLEIPEWLLRQMHKHVQLEHPKEASGMVARRRDGAGVIDTTYRHTAMTNIAKHPREEFAWSTEEQLKLWETMDREGTEPWIIYHSHTETTPDPSRVDRDAAWFPGVHYLIFSTAGGKEDLWYESWLCIKPGELIQEAIEVLQ